jgi:hypothetical protein
MLSAVEPLRAGSLVVSEAGLEDVGTQKQQLLAPPDLASMDPQVDQVVSEVASAADSTVVEAEAGSEEASKTAEAMVVDEGVSATKAAVDFLPEVVTVVLEIGVGMEVPTAIMHHQTLQLDQVAVVVASQEVEGGMAAPDLQIATALQPLLVGMTRVVAVARMMTGLVGIVEAATEVMIAMALEVVAVAAIWSR